MNEDDLRKGDVQAALDELGRRAHVEYLGQNAGTPVALVPEDFRVQSLKPLLDEYLPRPERRKGTVVLTELGSLAEYVNLYKAGETLVYVDDRNTLEPTITVVFDEHEPLPLAKSAEAKEAGPLPGWREHRARYLFPLTNEWKAWVDVSTRWLSQAELAAFLEDHVVDVVNPADPGESARKMAEDLGLTLAGANRLLELSRGLSINVEQRVVNAQNLTSGEGRIVFEEQHKDAASGAPLSIPGAFAIAVPVFRGGDRYRIAVRLRYRVEAGRVKWSLRPHRLDLVFENAIEGAAAYLREKTAVIVLRGAAGDNGK